MLMIDFDETDGVIVTPGTPWDSRMIEIVRL